MAGVAGSMLLMLAFLALRGGGGDHMALLYSGLDLREAAQIADQLDRAKISHEVQGDGSRIVVPSTQIASARLLLAKEGLPSGGSIGYEIFDRGDGLTASQFQQAISQTRAMEGELSRSIRMVAGVKAARVHLVLPKREPFVREKQDPQASIVLTMAGAGRMDREGVQAILTLVAAAVPGLRAQNIGIIDSRGNVLARAGDVTGPAAEQQTADTIRHTTEQRLSRAVEDMLERSLGSGRVRAETAVDMDFDHVKETQEKFDPDGRVERSTQNTTDNNRTTEQAGAVTVQNNLPNADAGNNPAGSQDQRTEETTNYEIGKTVRTVVREQPTVRRISLAVLVDQVAVRGGDGATTWQDRTPEELSRIGTLARSAIGFDEKRGDKVEVVSMRFTEIEGPAEIVPPSFLGLPIDKADLVRLGQTGLMGLVAIAALLLVLRPMVVRLTTFPAAIGSDAQALTLAGSAGMLQGPLPAGLRPASAIAGSAGPSGSNAQMLLEDESMVSLDAVDGAIRASSIRKVADLVQRHPDETLAIMRGWMVQEARAA